MRRDGTPQMSPVGCAVDDQGRVVVSSRETAIKVKNVRRDPRAWMCVFPDQFYGGFVQVEGAGTVVSFAGAVECLLDNVRSVAGEHPDWDDCRAAMKKEKRVLMRLDLSRAGPDIGG